MNFSLKSFTPPKGTEIIIKRKMTFAERKMQGRKKYANYIVLRLCNIISLNDISVVHAKADGTKITVAIKDDIVIINFKHPQWSSIHHHQYPIFDEKDGEYSFEKWLAEQDPCVGARLLKDANKQIRDMKSYHGQKRKEINTIYESRTEQLRNLGFVSDAVGYSNDHYALTFKQITESPDAEWNAFINAISIVEKFTK